MESARDWSSLAASRQNVCSDGSPPLPDPQFVKATTLRHEEPHQDKIYYFFREDNPDKSPEAPRNISRVAQLCKVPGEQRVSAGEAHGWHTDAPALLVLPARDLAPLAPLSPLPQGSRRVQPCPLVFPSAGSHPARSGEKAQCHWAVRAL